MKKTTHLLSIFLAFISFIVVLPLQAQTTRYVKPSATGDGRSEERRVGKECA